jgi:hypothetical protein
MKDEGESGVTEAAAGMLDALSTGERSGKAGRAGPPPRPGGEQAANKRGMNRRDNQ